MRQREAGFIDIAGDVGGVEKKHVAGLRTDTADVAVVQIRLDDVAQLAMPQGKAVIALESRRTNVDRGFEIGAIESIVADFRRGEGAGERGCLADGVGGIAQGNFRQEAPARGRDRHGEMGMEVEPSHIACVEERLGAVEIAER